MKKTTNSLTNILRHTRPSRIENYLKQNAEEILPNEKPFAQYMRGLFREKNVLQQDVFLRADISEGYGYKLIAEEKRTRRRDTILRLCLGARFSLEETQRALKIYGMSPLYARFSRDAVLISAISSGIYEIADVNALLTKHGQAPLRTSAENS
ncbi:MAG: hypothetical protein Q4D81_09090 [Eubacteriales bacterium]|nr:hypothetical protein [Eubacteriales bacterium]